MVSCYELGFGFGVGLDEGVAEPGLDCRPWIVTCEFVARRGSCPGGVVGVRSTVGFRTTFTAFVSGRRCN